ncbi:hypothetical protein JW921_06970 [Candidatus Fermentibacterales bacterium]|nr:hypothetical protein [Candidatus Fermentibacterales bacterium]
MKVELDEVRYVTETSVTIRGSRRRTTVPKRIAELLDLRDGSRIRWVVLGDRTVILGKPAGEAPPVSEA